MGYWEAQRRQKEETFTTVWFDGKHKKRQEEETFTTVSCNGNTKKTGGLYAHRVGVVYL